MSRRLVALGLFLPCSDQAAKMLTVCSKNELACMHNWNLTFKTLVMAHIQGLKDLGSLGVPVYVTETGIPDRTGKKREEFFKSYPPQVSTAIILICIVTSSTSTVFASL